VAVECSGKSAHTKRRTERASAGHRRPKSGQTLLPQRTRRCRRQRFTKDGFEKTNGELDKFAEQLHNTMLGRMKADDGALGVEADEQ